MVIGDDFEDPRERAPGERGARFVVDIDGFEGPIDMLLTLARDQKVDLTQVSILQLADQYLAFVVEARSANLELAADYLVMAAWLAYLKSRLLLPELGAADEPSGEEMAAALAFQLQRLEAMQECGARLLARPRRGREAFVRGLPDELAPIAKTVLEVTLYDLLKAYGDHRRRTTDQTLRIEPLNIHSMKDALGRLARMLGRGGEWESLWRFLPENVGDGVMARSAFASTFVASLELAREGRLHVRQSGTYGPIFVRGADPAGEADGQ
jgi:segregation and condensation protein A